MEKPKRKFTESESDNHRSYSIDSSKSLEYSENSDEVLLAQFSDIIKSQQKQKEKQKEQEYEELKKYSNRGNNYYSRSKYDDDDK